jgi:hypothetical protein
VAVWIVILSLAASPSFLRCTLSTKASGLLEYIPQQNRPPAPALVPVLRRARPRLCGLILSGFLGLLDFRLGGDGSVADAAMRTVVLSISAAALLGTGVAFTVQGTRPPSRPIEAPQGLPQAAAVAPPQVAEVAPTPMTFRQVRSVSIAEPKPGAEPSPQAAAEEDRTLRVAIVGAGGPAATASVAAPVLKAPANTKSVEAAAPNASTEEAAPLERSATKPALARKRYTRHWRKNARRQAASKEDAPSLPPAALAYDGSHEEHTPLYSLGKVFGGAQ